MNRKGTAKLNIIKDIELVKQKEWESKKFFESSPDLKASEKNKYFVTFPYPYMNGSLHLGHAFSLSKCEFSMGYERLKGKNTLWGFGLHCTGMPIKSSSDKLQREMKAFGYPPTFPQQEIEKPKEEEKQDVMADKARGKKSKAAAKSGGYKYQWQIMRANGMSDEEILKFTDSNYWLQYYPPLTVDHMKRMGIKVDWRRSFITTDANPFYDSFVKWQFLKLKESNKIMFGKRQTIFSPSDNQPCMDHDRATGEGVGPQEYTLIKMELIKPYPSCLLNIDNVGNKGVFFVAATLRPETMYGQTNCWIHPDIDYVAVQSDKHGILICVERAARNMAYQEILSNTNQGEVRLVKRLKGLDLLGCGLKAPMTSYNIIYTLPMLTIKSNKGTGIVTSVPSDSPDDFAALRDLKKKEAMRKKYGIRDDQVLPFEPIPIIDIPEYGSMCAVRCVEEMKIQSQNDTEKLLEAKEKCYKLGFYSGKMMIGKHADLPVHKAKELIQSELILEGFAIKYSEPEKQVISRSGDECVVALCDQWYLNYRDPDWKLSTKACLDQLNTYGEEVRRNFEATLENLHEYACSRSYGLGTRLPWDEQYLVESLSDSTIYMAFYTVAHMLQGDRLDGNNGGNNKLGIKPEQMTPEAWEYVLGNHHQLLPNKLSDDFRSKLDLLRSEFLYWYPVDLRVSGKDLIPNHLTYYLYNHVAMWPENPAQFWPQNIRANGHLLLNNEKMSKSTGNFLTVVDAIEKYSADGMRLAIADSGDTIEDANFVEDMADAGLLKLYQLKEWVSDIVDSRHKMRSGPLTLHSDIIFKNALNRTIREVDCHYREMMFKKVVQFAFHELQSIRDRYIETCMGSLHADLIMKFIEIQCILLSPICPHITDYIWTDILKKGKSILQESWPIADAAEDPKLSIEERYLDEISHEFRKQSLQKPKGISKPHNAAIIWVAQSYPPWQMTILDLFIDLSVDGILPDNKLVNQKLAQLPDMKKRMKKAMDFIQVIRVKTAERSENVARLRRPEIDEKKVIEVNIDYMRKTLNLEMGRLQVKYSSECDDAKLFDSCCPMEPKIMLLMLSETKSMSRTIGVVNPELFSGLVSHDIEINDGDSYVSVVRKIAEKSSISDFLSIDLYHFVDTKKGLSLIPQSCDIFGNLKQIDRQSTFIVTPNNIQLSCGSVITNDDIGTKIKYFLRGN